MRILVTGGAGFVGSYIQDALLEADHEVAIVDNLSGGRKENINSKARFYQEDITDRTKIEQIFSQFKPEAVYHLAAQMDVRKSVADPQFDVKVNIIGGLNLLEACREAKVKKIIFSSTGGAIYGEQNYFPADENHPTRPLCPYGIDKLSFEHFLYYYHKIYDLSYIILRYANVYGPRQNPHGEAGVVAIFMNKLLNNEPLTINGDGKQTRDFVFVKDVVSANLAALKYQKSDIFNVGTGIETDINLLADTILKVSQKSSQIIHNPAKIGEQKRSVITAQKAYKKLDIKISYNLNQGIEQTWQYFAHS